MTKQMQNYYKRTVSNQTTHNYIHRMACSVISFVSIILLLIVIPGVGGAVENHYWASGFVIDISNNEVVVEDKSGNLWAFEGEGFDRGDKVKMLMFTNYTDHNRQDDEIIKVIKQTK